MSASPRDRGGDGSAAPSHPAGAPSLAALFRKDPAAFLKRTFAKLLVGPLKYGTGSRFDPSRFWRDRYSKYGLSLQGSGDEGFSEAENRAMYERAAAAFLEACRRAGVSLAGRRVLDIGCGTGFYTALLREQGVAAYTGVDVTDVLFERHRGRFPGYRFLRADATVEELSGEYDLVIMLDVIQSIVTRERLDFALQNARRAMAPGAAFVVAPLMPETRKHLFYMHFWSRRDLERNFPGYAIGESLPFRNDSIAVIRNP